MRLFLLQLGFMVWVFSAGCRGSEVQVFTQTRVLMGTAVTISVYAADEPAGWRAAVARAFAEIARLESVTTSYNDSSDIGQINLNAGKHKVGACGDVVELLEQAYEISKLSNGAFDVTILPLLRLWRFRTDNPHVPDSTEIKKTLKLVDYRGVSVDSMKIGLVSPGMGVDLGGIAKGYAVDRAVEVLLQAGLTDLMVEAGGDLRAVAGDATTGLRKIWIRDPRNRDALFGYVRMDAGAVATSGDYEHFFETGGQRYHHILDPADGYPARLAVSVTIFAASTARADALSTAVFVLGPEQGMALIEKMPGVEGLIIYPDSESATNLSWKASRQLTPKLVVVND